MVKSQNNKIFDKLESIFPTFDNGNTKKNTKRTKKGTSDNSNDFFIFVSVMIYIFCGVTFYYVLFDKLKVLIKENDEIPQSIKDSLKIPNKDLTIMGATELKTRDLKVELTINNIQDLFTTVAIISIPNISNYNVRLEKSNEIETNKMIIVRYFSLVRDYAKKNSNENKDIINFISQSKDLEKNILQYFDSGKYMEVDTKNEIIKNIQDQFQQKIQ